VSTISGKGHKAVYPRWQSFLANTSQQFFGTADYDTARYLSGALGQQTISFETQGSSYSDQGITKPGSVSASTGGNPGPPPAHAG